VAFCADFATRLQHGLRFAVRLGAQYPARSQEQSLIAIFSRQRCPDGHGVGREFALGHFMGERIEQADRGAHVASIEYGGELLHDPRLRAHVRRQFGGGKTLPLQVLEGFTGLDRAILPCVAHQREAGDLGAMGEAHKVGSLFGTER